MAGESRAGAVVAGAVVGVLLTLGALFGLSWGFDEHFVTRREYGGVVTRLDRIEGKLDKVQTAVDENRGHANAHP